MAASTGKTPDQQLRERKEQELAAQQRRERRVRRSKKRIPLVPPAVSPGSVGDAHSKQVPKEAPVVVRKPPATNKSSVKAKGKPPAKSKSPAESRGPARRKPTTKVKTPSKGKAMAKLTKSKVPRRPNKTARQRQMTELLAMLGSSEEDDEHNGDSTFEQTPNVLVDPPTSESTSGASPPTSEPTSGASREAPPTSEPTSGASREAPPTSKPTPSDSAVVPPTSEPTFSATATTTPPTSEPTTAPVMGKPPTTTTSSVGKRKRKRLEVSETDTGSPEDSAEENLAQEEDGHAVVDGVNVEEGDPCFTNSGNAQKESALDSESEESSSELGDFEDSNVDDWELVNLSDEEDEDDAGEELPVSEFLRTANNKDLMKNMRKTGWEYDPEKFGANPTYQDLYEGPFGPSSAVMRIAEDPLALFFFFLPPQLWRQIQKETNIYHKQNIEKRVTEIRRSQRKVDPENVEPKKDLRVRLRAVESVKPHEILRVIGLLIARMLCPHAKGLSAHWRKRQHGAVPLGTFGQWLSRNRFDHVMQNLHFTNSRSTQAGVDRGWKVRSVVTTLQKTFARGYRPGPVIAFDEAIIPTRSRQNPTRQYLPQKPHKWGTKFFAACCGDTAYCMRIELYVGAKTHLTVPPAADNSCGAAAVIRNIDQLIPRSAKAPYRLLVTDRYYTSVVLALELLHRRLYLTGTIQTRRAGFAEGVVTKKKVYNKKPSVPARGTVMLAENKLFPQLTAAMWMDNHPVHMISSGGSRLLGPVLRRVGSEKQDFPAPGLVRDYQKWMGGVDVHDQLRMQRYSIHAYKPKKYYRSLFFGLVDMAIVNAFIVHRYYMKCNNQRAPEHSKFMSTLHEQLLAVDEDKFEEIEAATRPEDRTAASPVTPGSCHASGENGEHYIDQYPDYVGSKKGRKRVARSCKVCAVYQVKPRKFTNTFAQDALSTIYGTCAVV